jgi:lipopolysaccharide biosynthesis regulator YciM
LSDFLTWLVVGSAAVAAAVVLWRIWVRPRPEANADDYQQALQLWIEGEREDAAAILRRVVQKQPEAFEPFLYLGNLLREMGDAGRAVVLHRGLTMRGELTPGQKIASGLALAEDLLALQQFTEAGQVLDTLQRHSLGNKRYWRARFAQHQGAKELPDAARVLKQASKQLPEHDGAWFREAYASFQLDRAVGHALAGEAGEAKARLRDVENMPESGTRAALVRAILAARADDAAGALTEATDNLLDHPEELDIFLPLLQDALLRGGQFTRTIPLLETACLSENAPASFAINLAILYEKLDQRDKAMRVLTIKTGQADLTPDVAAPYLRMLVRENPETQFARVWKMLQMPRPPVDWVCGQCGRSDPRVRWFCPDCRSFGSHRRGWRRREDS